MSNADFSKLALPDLQAMMDGKADSEHDK